MAEKIRIKLEVSQELINKASVEFYHFFGHTMSVWAGLERSLYYWFAHITKMENDMAAAIFYGARGFGARADMLEAAIQTTKELPAGEIPFIKEATKKARLYSAFRNRMAHGEPRLTLTKSDGFDSEGPATAAHYTIQSAKELTASDENDLTVLDLNIAAGNIGSLRRHIMAAASFLNLAEHKTPEECLALVLALPNEPHNSGDRTGSEPAPPPQHPHHRNKKQFRVLQAKKKAKGSGEPDSV